MKSATESAPLFADRSGNLLSTSELEVVAHFPDSTRSPNRKEDVKVPSVGSSTVIGGSVAAKALITRSASH